MATLTDNDPHPMSSIARLHTAVVDATNGFENIVDKAEDDLLPIAQQLLSLHQKHSIELALFLSGNGIDADEDGSFMSMVQNAVLTLRALFDDIDDDVIPSIIASEQHLVEIYDEVFTDVTAASNDVVVSQKQGALQLLISNQRADLAQAIDRLKLIQID